MEQTQKPRDAVLDFWRGIGIILVIWGHLVSFRLHGFFLLLFHTAHWPPAMRPFVAWTAGMFFDASCRAGGVGVTVFLIISGYIITKMLLDEERARGSISIGRFYARRFFRIVPAYALYIASAAFFIASGWIATSTFPIPCVLFLANTTWQACTPVFSHFWSLSVEEQFYAVWPFFLALVVAPLRVRVLVSAYLALVAYVASGFFVDHAWVGNKMAFGAVAAGCLYALSPYLRNRILSLGVAGDAIVGLLAADMLMGIFNPDYFLVRFLQPGFAAFGLLHLIFRLRRPIAPVRTLMFKIVCKIGLVSYSLYLWQNIFSVPLEYPAGSPLARWWLMFPVALISYFTIERPVAAWARKRYAYIHHADAIRPAS